MIIEKELRKMARSTYWQNLYQSSKELSNVGLFLNDRNLSGLQVLFLYWLKVYHSVYESINSMDFDFLDDKILKDDERIDAFLYWRGQYYEAERRKYKEEEDAKKYIKNPKKGRQSFCNVDLRSK